MKQGFTLVELSIVLVIIGLLAGGVVVGSSLIESANQRALISQINEMKVAMNTFKLKYDSLPGDMSNASSYWGAEASCTSGTSAGSGTCNGNGDGSIDYVNTDTSIYESWRAWEQLGLSQLIGGTFTGVSKLSDCTGVNNCSVANENAPASKISPNAAWVLFRVKASWGWVGKNETRHIFALGTPLTVSAPLNAWRGDALTTEQQSIIDRKMDDGMPFTGEVTDMSGTDPTYSPNCTSSTSADYSTPTATYNLSYTGPACVMFVDLE